VYAGESSDPLLVDVYSLSRGGKPDWAALVAAGPPWHGATLKVSEGVGGGARWQLAMGQWFQAQWSAVREAAGDRYGEDFFRGGYHYLLIGVDGVAQADHYLQRIEAAGGWGPGDLWPIVTVEEGSGNRDNSPQAILDTTSAFVEAVRAKTGSAVMLRGGWWLADKRIRDKMGCSWLWYPNYTAQLPPDRYEQLGWTREDLFAWQYVGGGKGARAGYPHQSPLGDTDISAVTIAGGGAAALAWLRANLRPTGPAQLERVA
jgi:hypothetical protein